MYQLPKMHLKSFLLQNYTFLLHYTTKIKQFLYMHHNVAGGAYSIADPVPFLPNPNPRIRSWKVFPGALKNLYLDPDPHKICFFNFEKKIFYSIFSPDINI